MMVPSGVVRSAVVPTPKNRTSMASLPVGVWGDKQFDSDSPAAGPVFFGSASVPMQPSRPETMGGSDGLSCMKPPPPSFAIFVKPACRSTRVITFNANWPRSSRPEVSSMVV